MRKKEKYRKQVRILKALANEARVTIIENLYKKECSVSELTEIIDLDMSTISKHLTVLFSAGIVDYRKDKNQVYYKLLTPCVVDMLNCNCLKAKI